MILAVGYIDVSMAVRVVFTVGCLLLLPLAWKGIANLWADRTRAFDEPPAAWPYSEALWRGWVRAMPSGVAMFTLGALDVLWGLWGASDLHVALGVTCVTLGAAAVAALVAVAVAFLGRPQFAVPPARRDQPGAIAEWRRNWRRRREAGSAP